MKFLLLAMLPFLFGFRFNPMSQSLEISEKKSAQFTVENDTAEAMAIELSVRERVMNELGVEEHPATTLMTIFPPQMIIPPKEKRSVRVNWTGEKSVPVEKAFRVIAEQLPLEVNKDAKKKTGIKMLMRYIAALYVAPEKAEAKVSASIKALTPQGITVLVENSGNTHQILSKPELTFKKGSQKWVLKDENLNGLSGENVLAQSKRLFELKSTEKIPQDAAVTIKLDE